MFLVVHATIVFNDTLDPGSEAQAQQHDATNKLLDEIHKISLAKFFA